MASFLAGTLLPQCLHGLVYGMTLALVAIGLSLVFGVMHVINFAHGEFLMVGAFVGYTVYSLTGSFWLGLLAGGSAGAALGGIIERFTLRPLYPRHPTYLLLGTYGLSLVLVEVARIVWGAVPQKLPPPFEATVHFLGLDYPAYRLALLAFTSAILAALWVFLTRTQAGTIIRGVAQDRMIMEALGVNVARVFAATFALGAGLAAVSGVLLAPLLAVYATMGLDVILSAFAVIIIGGLGSFPGTLLASVIVGMVESVSTIWISPTSAKTLTFIVMVLILLVRPAGLLGEETR
jgi:branched-subunit amino acid ABC-type transport system permease component